MDFESPDEIERSYNKKQPVARKVEVQEAIQVKKQRFEEVYNKEEVDSFDVEGSDSEYGSEYEQPANTTESSIDESADTEESEYDDMENAAGFRRLDADSSKKKLVIKDGRIIKGDKLKIKDKDGIKVLTKGGKIMTKKATGLIKTSPSSLSGFNLNVASYESVSVSPPSPRGKESNYKVNGIKPIDVAAHLKLLGESLTIIGLRLKEHEGQIAVSGSLSVLLDSLLCALGPLLCLTQQVPELQENCCDPEQLISTLDNVAFIMPGL